MGSKPKGFSNAVPSKKNKFAFDFGDISEKDDEDSTRGKSFKKKKCNASPSPNDETSPDNVDNLSVDVDLGEV